MRLGATSTESSYSAPKRLAAPISTTVKKPNLLAQVYNYLLSVPGPQTSSPVNTGRGVSMGGQGNALQVAVEPIRVAGRRAVGDFTAIPGIGEPSPSPTAADVKRGNYLGPALDYVTLASSIVPASKIKTPIRRIVKQTPELEPLAMPRTSPGTKTPPSRMTRADNYAMFDSGIGVERPIGTIELRTYNSQTGEINGYATILFEEGQPASLNQLFSNSPSASMQLTAAAKKISKDLLPDYKHPIRPSSDLSVHSYPFVKRLQEAGLVDPDYSLPNIEDLNSFNRSNTNMETFLSRTPGKETVVNPMAYQATYADIRAALARARRMRNQRAITSRQLQEIVDKRGPRSSGINYWLDDLMDETWVDE